MLHFTVAMDDWHIIQNIMTANCSSDAHYLVPLLRLISRNTFRDNCNTYNNILELIHKLFKDGTHAKFYRRMVCHDRLCVTIIPSVLITTDRNTYVMRDDIIDREFESINDLFSFLKGIQEQIMMQ